MAIQIAAIPFLDRAVIFDSVHETFFPMAFESIDHAEDFLDWIGDGLDEARHFAAGRGLYAQWFDVRVDEETGELVDDEGA